MYILYIFFYNNEDCIIFFVFIFKKMFYFSIFQLKKKMNIYKGIFNKNDKNWIVKYKNISE